MNAARRISLLIVAVSTLVVLQAAAAHAAPVIVSLEFDDGTADHATAAQILNARALAATFFVNTSRLDRPGYLTAAQVDALAAAGNEIGGHTLTHALLPSLPLAEQQREICDDRRALMARGLRVTAFAYPFGAENTALQEIVRACGYNSARITSDIRSAAGCIGCPWAESVPPANRYRVRIPQSVRTTTSLADLQATVRGARDHGGGWIGILMHRVCNGCSANAIAPSTLAALADWLIAQPDIKVRTVDQVIGGPLLGPVPGPALPPPSTASNVLNNASLETHTNPADAPDCWRYVAYLGSDGRWSTVTDARSGRRAERVQASRLDAGAANRLVVKQDNGTCAPSVTVGQRYTVGAWTLGTAKPRLIAFRRTGTGAWVSWAQSTDFPASSGWRKSEWTTPAVPEGTTSLSVGVTVYVPGAVSVDDLSLGRYVADTGPPTVTIASPVAGSTVSGVVPIEANAHDDREVVRVRFYLDGIQLGTRTKLPFRWNLDTASVTTGWHVLAVAAEDYVGHSTRSADVRIAVTRS